MHYLQICGCAMSHSYVWFKIPKLKSETKIAETENSFILTCIEWEEPWLYVSSGLLAIMVSECSFWCNQIIVLLKCTEGSKQRNKGWTICTSKWIFTSTYWYTVIYCVSAKFYNYYITLQKLFNLLRIHMQRTNYLQISNYNLTCMTHLQLS